MTRILTAIVVIALLAAALWAPWPTFAALLALTAIGAWLEYAPLAAAAGTPALGAPGAALAVVCVASFASPAAAAPGVAVGAALLFATALALRFDRGDPGAVVVRVLATWFGLLWIGAMLGSHLAVRRSDDGVAWLALAYGACALGDTAAFYGGRAFGRHRLARHLSPNKTIEGALLGVVGSAVAALIVGRWLPDVPPATLAAVGATLGVVGQLGDLLESSLKRAAGVKDSSSLRPGHGGILDRIDAHVPAGFTLYLLRLGGIV